jgi:hypothetical protein
MNQGGLDDDKSSYEDELTRTKLCTHILIQLTRTSRQELSVPLQLYR